MRKKRRVGRTVCYFINLQSSHFIMEILNKIISSLQKLSNQSIKILFAITMTHHSNCFDCLLTPTTNTKQLVMLTTRLQQFIFYRIISNVLTFIKCIARTSFVILNNVYCIPTYVVWMTLLFPVKVYQPQVYWRIEGLFFHWLLAMVSMWTWSAGYDSKQTMKYIFQLYSLNLRMNNKRTYFYSNRTRRRHTKTYQ